MAQATRDNTLAEHPALQLYALRRDMQRAIDALIGALDAIGLDPDLEPDDSGIADLDGLLEQGAV
jgi:hypothetical protein